MPACTQGRTKHQRSCIYQAVVEHSRGDHKEGTLKVYSGLAAHLQSFEKKEVEKSTFKILNWQHCTPLEISLLPIRKY
jgi:hypothetical protein